MSLYKDRLLDHLNGFWDEGVDRVCDVADNLEKNWHRNKKRARKRAKKSYREGRDQVMSIEEAIADNIRRNPSIFVAVGALLVALIVGKILMKSGCCSTSNRYSEGSDW